MLTDNKHSSLTKDGISKSSICINNYSFPRDDGDEEPEEEPIALKITILHLLRDPKKVLNHWREYRTTWFNGAIWTNLHNTQRKQSTLHEYTLNDSIITQNVNDNFKSVYIII